MSAVAQLDPSPSTPDRREVLLNFCRVVLRSDDTHLQLAIEEYRRSLLDTLAGRQGSETVIGRA